MPNPIYLNLQAIISQDVAIRLVTAVQTKLKEGMTELHLLMASPGGHVDSGMAIYNFLRGIPVPVTTYNYGSVDSVAGVIYCAGSHRVATPHCKFLVHGINWPLNQTLTEHQLREILGQMDAMKKNIASVLSEATGKPQAQIVADITSSLTLTAEEAKEYGLVHELKTALIPAGAEVVAV
jgi:ATP-dependent protease ClpP protease subunit